MTVNYLIGGSSTLQNELIKLLSEQKDEQTKDVEPSNEPEANKQTNDNGKNKETSDEQEATPGSNEQANEQKDDETNKESTVEIKEVISDAITKQNSEDAKFVNSEMSGGTNIVGLVENILAGGNLNNPDNEETINENSNNAKTTGEEIISNILVEGGNKHIVNGGDKQTTEQPKDVEPKCEPKTDSQSEEIIKEILVEGGKGENDENNEDETTDEDDDEDEEGGENETTENDDETNEDETTENDDEDEDDDTYTNKYIKIISEMRKHSSSPSSVSLTGGSVQSVNRVKVLNMYPWILKSTD